MGRQHESIPFYKTSTSRTRPPKADHNTYTLNGARHEIYLRGRCWIQGSNRALSFLKCLEFCGDATVGETVRAHLVRIAIGNT